MKYIIVAYDKNRLIGGNNSLLWQGDMKADIRHFRELTTGNVVIMGRKTFESIGLSLPNRQNIVISHQPLKIDNVQVFHSLEDAYKISDFGKDIYIIGGGQIYNQAIGSVDRILSTEIDAVFEGNVYFPQITNEWHEISRQDNLADENNKYNYSFVTYSKSTKLQ
jgi:dihydrofolate reductase